jgi:hypothetical protein
VEAIDFNEHDNFQQTLTLTEARGNIAPLEYDRGTIEVIEGLMRGDYHSATNKDIICKCIDGRNCEDGLEGPNSAGGTLSLLVADDLTDRRFIRAEERFDIGMERLVNDFSERVIPIGVHTDTHASNDPEKSGCGANDRIGQIYAFMIERADHIKELSETILGMKIKDAIHESIILNASRRMEFSSGKALHAAAVNASKEIISENLVGDHSEIVAIINMRYGTTLDRTRMGAHQAFNVDAWAFEESARAIADRDTHDVTPHVVALTYYNIATAHALCGPSMKVGMLK